MDLSISPDWDARLCYGVVLLCGVISARIQVYKRFVDMNISGVWLVRSTWLMFGIYLLLPLGLFWLMDRTGALNDTSLFAALLVGLAYPAILAGGVGGLKAPGGLEGILKPLQVFTDTVIKSAIKRSTRNMAKFEDFVVGRMRADPQIFNAMLQLTKNSSADSPKLETELAQLPASGITDQSLLVEKKARRIYLYLSAIPDFEATLTRNKELMGHWWLKLKSPIIKTRLVVCLATLLFVGFVYTGAYVATRPSTALMYYVWRLGKANNSERDRFRARENLRLYLQDTNMVAITCQSLAYAIRAPELPVARVDLFLQLLLQVHDQPDHQDLVCSQLVDDLRVDNVDARSRVQQALVFLATKHDPQFKEKEKELAAWVPSTGDAVTSLETWVGRWKVFFGQ